VSKRNAGSLRRFLVLLINQKDYEHFNKKYEEKMLGFRFEAFGLVVVAARDHDEKENKK
jgi:hypothetical protein